MKSRNCFRAENGVNSSCFVQTGKKNQKSKCGFVTILLKKTLYKPHKTIYNAYINKKKPHKFEIKQT